MRVLRSTLHLLNQPPVTVVCRDIDMAFPIEEVIQTQLKHANHQLLWWDVFDVPDGTHITVATFHAKERLRQNLTVETDLKMLFYWTLDQLAQIKPNGKLLMDKPMPLSAVDIEKVFAQIVKTPYYRNQTIVGFDQARVRVEHASTPLQDYDA